MKRQSLRQHEEEVDDPQLGEDDAEVAPADKDAAFYQAKRKSVRFALPRVSTGESMI